MRIEISCAMNYSLGDDDDEDEGKIEVAAEF